jgi:MYXO-CTERM domain-containing protein
MNNSTTPLFRKAALLLVFPCSCLHAADIFWVGGTSRDWNTASNWSTGTVPGTGDNPRIDINGLAPGTFQATITADVSQTIDILVSRGGANPNSPGILNHTAGTAATGGGNWIDVGTDGGNGVYNLANTNASGGTLTNFGTGSGSVSGQRLYIGGVDFGGGGGTGLMNVNTTGTVTVRNDLSIGVRGGTGVMNLDAGTVTSGGWNFVGRELGSVTGGNGTLRISGGTLRNVNLSDPNAGRFYFGDGNATGRLEMSGGTLDNSQSFIHVGQNNNAAAQRSSILMTGGTVNTTSLIIGGNGKGVVDITNNSALMNASSEVWVGDGGTGNGEMNVSAGTVRAANWMAVGRGGATGVLNISGTGLVEKNDNGSFEIGNNAASNGTVNLNGGTLRVDEIVTGGGTSNFNFNGGVLKPIVNATNFMQGLTAAKVKSGGAVIDTAGFEVTINQALLADAVSTGGGLTKNGAGKLTLGGANTYTGLTTVSSGTLVVTGSITGDVTVATGASLGGSGNILGSVVINNDASLIPGTSPGTLTTGSLTLSNSTAVVFELDTAGTVGGGVNDWVNVSGNLTLDGNLSILPLAGFGVGSYRLFDYSGTLTNNGLALDPAFLTAWPGSTVDTSTGGQVNLTVVPEPAAGTIALAGLAALLGRRRRNR